MNNRSTNRWPSLRGSAAALCLLLSGCVATPYVWELQDWGTAGSALVAESKGKAIQVACRLNPSDLYVRIDGLQAIPGARAIWIRAGGHTAMLPMLTGSRASAVEAAASVPETFLYMLNSTVPFEISYGSRKFHFAAFDEPTREAMAIACGKSAGIYIPSP